MSTKQKIVCGVVAFFIFILMLLATAPASLLERTARAKIPGLMISGSSGTVWQGRAQQLNVGWLQLSDIEWRISPWALLIGKLKTDLQFGGTQEFRGSLNLSARVSEQQLTHVDLKIPASRVQAFINMPGVQLSGDFYLQADEIVLSDQQLRRVIGRLQWNGAMVQTPLGQPPLGSYAVDMRTEESGAIVGDIKDLEGVLDLRGQLHYAHPMASISATTRADLPEQLDRFFRAVGRKEGDRYLVSWQQEIR